LIFTENQAIAPMSKRKILVCVEAQRLDLYEDGVSVATWPVSTSRFGLGCEEGSLRTPLGRFRIAEKIGAGQPSGTIFRGRVPQGVWVPGDSEEVDMVLTRILWLDGVEAHNANTKARYIYIHGTQAEDLLGTPASHGCVRMANADIADLFERVEPGDAVEILLDSGTEDGDA